LDIITEALIDPFQYGFMVRALVVAAVVGVMCPVAGVYVVTRGLGFMSDGLAHSVLPGIVAAALLGSTAASVFAGGIPMAIVMALLSGYLIKRAGVAEDASVGILFAALFAIGVIMISVAASQGISVSVSLENLLLGNVLGVSRVEMYVTLGVAAAVMLMLYGLHKELVFSNFDPTGASVVGLPTEKLEYMLLALLAMVVVVALQAVGIILVISMLITPAAAALQLTRSFAGAMMVAALIGVASGVAGLYLSYHFNLPSGPVMALVAFSFFILSIGWKQKGAGILQHRRARHV
jgi:ABC-type Mn2+/Zn2+ transport system permease subunit